ncbi:MAG: histidine triad nucleotide-binding protein [Candidatus Solincola sediminis]|nr:MAG: histidine triad nucleotide-binding protein [Candidatus Solincola sediminis]
MEGCIFCDIAEGRMEADIVYADDQMVAFRDINPQAPVHDVVITRRHITSALELTTEDSGLLSDLFQAIEKVAEIEGVAEGGIRIVTNVGIEADQVIKHLHFHILGGRKMHWPPG